MARLAVLFLAQLAFTATCVATPIDLDLNLVPSAPDPATEIVLGLSSEQAWVAVDLSAESNVELTGQTIFVTVNLTPPASEIRLPAFEQLDITVDIGMFPAGLYDVQARLFGETAELFGTGSASLTVVPEPSTAFLAIIGLAAGQLLRFKRVSSGRAACVW